MLPLLESAAPPGDPARVVNVGSIDGVPAHPDLCLLGQQGRAAHLTRVLTRKLGPRGITVNAIAPGPSSRSTGATPPYSA
jgi:NAD(P)-dependent dehydrogenase (short-subunit alcohol dehydrogenase family)